MTTKPQATLNESAWKTYAEAVETHLSNYLDQRTMSNALREAIKYSLMAPGKRTRPILTLASCHALNGDTHAALPPAGAIEMIHCFSLIHDDLPAMDDDDLRRGRPTLHKHVSEALAILTGDSLNTLPCEMIAAQVTDASTALKLILELTQATQDMISGQVYDTLQDFDGLTEPMDQLKLIHRNKTGALIRCSCRMGAIAANADENGLQIMTTYGEAIGLMFQVVDDILDVTQSTEQLGKTAGKDTAQDKMTYPALVGLDESRAIVARLRTQAFEALSSLGDNADVLRELCEYLAVRTK